MSRGRFHRLRTTCHLAWDEIRLKTGRWPFRHLPPPTFQTAPPATVACHQGLFEAVQIDRVTACGFDSTIDQEIAKLRATEFIESPMTAHAFGPATLIGGRILTDQASCRLSAGDPFADLFRSLVEIPKVHLTNTMQGLRFFGHWLGDDCPMREAFRDDPDAWSMVLPDWSDRTTYMAAFGQTWRELPHAHIDGLTVYRELGFNRDKARRIRALRDRVRNRNGDRAGDGQIFYIRRGRTAASRTMSNESALEAAMEAVGIRILTPETDANLMISQLRDARLIITIEGSQARHATYSLADGGAILILQPPDRFYNPHHEWARLLGMGYGIVIGEADADGFSIRPDEVLRMVDRLLAAPRLLDA